MATTIDWTNKVISVYQSDLTLVSGTLYKMDTDAFRNELKSIEADDEGMVYEDTHTHNTEYTVAGVTYARSLEILVANGYSVQFLPDSQWSVRLEGSNNNIFDVEAGALVQNQVQVIPGNSAGLVNPAGSNPTAIASAVWGTDITGYTTVGTAGNVLKRLKESEQSVFVDESLVSNGNGTAGSPFNNIGDAIDYAEAQGVRTIVTFDEITVDRNLKNFIVVGTGHAVINCNGQDLTNTEFQHCTLRGTYTGSIIGVSCVLDNGFSLNGTFEFCGLNGDLTCIDLGDVIIANSYSTIPGLARPSISLNGAGTSTLSLRNLSGGLDLKDVNNVNDVVTIEMSQGKVTLESTCTNGVISVRGLTHFVDNSNGSTVDTTALAENLIWDKDISTYTVEGQAGLELQVARLKAALSAALSA